MSDHGTIIKWMTHFCLLVALALAGTSSHGAENRIIKQLNVLGTAVIHEKDLADGKQNALDDALVAAVGQVVMEMLTGETVVRRFKIINDHILAERDNYIQNYRVLAESVSGTTLRALVQVDVAADRISQDLSRLGLARADVAAPRILFMVAEKNVTDASFTYWWGESRLMRRTICEASMAVTLKAAGFDIVDPPDLSAPLGLPVNISDADRVALAGRFGADVLIAGSGNAAAAPNTMEAVIKSFEAVVEVRALNIRTGQPMGRTLQKSVVSGQDASMGGREALSAAGALAGDDVAQQIMAVWQQEQDRSALIEVAVEGTSGHIASFVRLRTIISSLSGVKELKMKAMSADRAAMAVNYQGSARSLADALLLKTFSGFGIDIVEVTPEAIRIRLVND